MNNDIISLDLFVPTLTFSATGSSRIDQTILLLLVYLCDWHSCVKYHSRIVNIDWKVSQYGLSEDGLESYLRTATNKFVVDDARQEVLCLTKPAEHLSEQVLSVINRVCSLYNTNQHSGLTTFVFSTYPILSASTLTLESVDLLEKAREYSQIREQEISEMAQHTPKNHKPNVMHSAQLP